MVFGADRVPGDHSGQGGVPRHALRVRRDAVVHDRACLADRAAMAAGARNKMREIPGDVEVAGEEDVWYKAPLNFRYRGVDVPVFAVIGGLGTFAAWIAVMALYTDALIVGIDLAGARLRHLRALPAQKGLSLTETHRREAADAVGAEPVRYAAVLVAFEEGTYSESAMAIALKLAAHRRGDVRVICDHHGAPGARPEGAAARGGGDRRGGDRGGAAMGRAGPARARADRAGAAGRGGPQDRAGGDRCALGGDRDADASPAPVRQACSARRSRRCSPSGPPRVIIDSTPAEPLEGQRKRELAGIT